MEWALKYHEPNDLSVLARWIDHHSCDLTNHFQTYHRRDGIVHQATNSKCKPKQLFWKIQPLHQYQCMMTLLSFLRSDSIKSSISQKWQNRSSSSIRRFKKELNTGRKKTEKKQRKMNTIITNNTSSFSSCGTLNYTITAVTSRSFLLWQNCISLLTSKNEWG